MERTQPQTLLSHYPAFICSLFFLLGLCCALEPRYEFFVCTCLCILLLLSRKSLKALSGIALIFLLAYGYGASRQREFPQDLENIEGVALFRPKELKQQSSPFQRGQRITGEILIFKNQERVLAKRVPCTVRLKSEKRPPLSHDFWVHGILCKKDKNRFELHSESWKKIPYTWSLTEWRFHAKRHISKCLKRHFKHKKVSSFLQALTTGELDDRMLRFEFSKLGLQHILAISGFHFGLLAVFLNFFLKKLLPKKIALSLLLFFATAYLIFLGNSPSILRAWAALCFYTVGQLLRVTPSGLNILGLAVLLELILDPHIIYHLGFQLSFLATAAILILLPMSTSLLQIVLPKRPVKTICEFSFYEKSVYFLCTYLRACLSLNFAVHLAMIPVCLFHFQKFPLLSLLYNLFFPLGVSVSLALLLIASPFFFLFPPLASFLCSINEGFTSFLLDFSSKSPAKLEFYLYASSFPLLFVLLFLIALFSIGIAFRFRRQHLP